MGTDAEARSPLARDAQGRFSSRPQAEPFDPPGPLPAAAVEGRSAVPPGEAAPVAAADAAPEAAEATAAALPKADPADSLAAPEPAPTAEALDLAGRSGKPEFEKAAELPDQQAEKLKAAVKPRIDEIKANSSLKKGNPCQSAVLDTRTGKIFLGRNLAEAPTDIHPLTLGIRRAFSERAGGVAPETTGKYLSNFEKLVPDFGERNSCRVECAGSSFQGARSTGITSYRSKPE